MHLSPKQDPGVFAGLVQAIGAKVVVPHHHDLTEPLLRSRPELIDQMLPPEAKEAYLVDGQFSAEAFVGRFAQVIKERVPTAAMMQLEHHKWYRFGLAWETQD